MDVTCSECSARYRVPDDRVIGRKVRLPCRRCGHFIIIDQRDPDRHSQPVLPGAGRSFREARPVAPLWHVSLPGGVEELTLDGIADRCRAGAIFAETYVWRPELTDWAMLKSLGGLRAALLARGVRFPSKEAGPSADWEGESTKVLGRGARSVEPSSSRSPMTVNPASWEGEATQVLERKRLSARNRPAALRDNAPPAASVARPSLETQPTSRRSSSIPPPLPSSIPPAVPAEKPSRSRPPPLPPRRSSGKLTRAEAVAPVRPPRAAALDDDSAGLTVVLAEELSEMPDSVPPGSGAAPEEFTLPKVPPAMAMRPTLPPMYAYRGDGSVRPPKPPSAWSLIAAAVAIFALVSVAAVAGYWLSQRVGLGGILAEPAGSSRAADPATSHDAPRASAVPPPARAVVPAVVDAGGSDARPPFDRSIAQAALESAALEAAKECADRDAARASARVWLSFLPSGKPVGVSLDGPLSGTPTGLCILRVFFKVSIHPFDGEAVSMGQAVNIP